MRLFRVVAAGRDGWFFSGGGTGFLAGAFWAVAGPVPLVCCPGVREAAVF